VITHIEEGADREKLSWPVTFNGTAVEIGRVFGGVPEGIDSPAQIVTVRTKVMTANVARGNRRNRRLALEKTGRCASTQRKTRAKNGREKGGGGPTTHDSDSRVCQVSCPLLQALPREM